jgi:regulator of replication initiation timing
VIKQVEKIQDIKSLDRIRDVLQEDLEIPANEIPSDRWTDQKEKFLDKVSAHLKANPFKSPFTRDQFESLVKLVDLFRKEIETLRQVEKSLNEKNSKLTSLNEDLKTALGSKESFIIEKKYFETEGLDKFKSLCEKATKALSKTKGIICGMIFIERSGKSLSIDFEGWDSVLQDALARDIILEGEYSFVVNWDNPAMKQVQKSLDEVERFIEQNEVNEGFTAAYENEFQATLSLSNLDFWEEVLGVQITFK